MQRDRRDARRPRETRSVTIAGVNGRPGRRHLRAAGRRAEDRLVVAQRVAPVEVAVRDRPPVPRQRARPGRRSTTARQSRLPRPVGEESVARVRLEQRQRARRRLRSARPAPRRARPGRRRARCGPRPPRCRRRAVSRRAARPAATVAASRVDLAGDGRGVVHDHDVAGAQVLGQVAEPRVGDAVGSSRPAGVRRRGRARAPRPAPARTAVGRREDRASGVRRGSACQAPTFTAMSAAR